jgi:hypothetical protein
MTSSGSRVSTSLAATTAPCQRLAERYRVAILKDPTPEKRRAVLDVLAVVATGATFLVWENVLRWPKFPFLAGCTLAWGTVLVTRIRRDRAVLRDWGLRRDTLPAASAACGVLLFLGTLGLGAYRVIAGWTGFPPTLWAVLALYPVWSFVQQFVVQALLASNLVRLGWPRAAVLGASAFLFGAAHLPDVVLAGLCAVAGLVWTAIFLWRPNLVPLALTHAWLGTLAYWWALGRNPWNEMFPG